MTYECDTCILIINWLMHKIHFITIERISKVHHGADFFGISIVWKFKWTDLFISDFMLFCYVVDCVYKGRCEL